MTLQARSLREESGLATQGGAEEIEQLGVRCLALVPKTAAKVAIELRCGYLCPSKGCAETLRLAVAIGFKFKVEKVEVLLEDRGREALL